MGNTLLATLLIKWMDILNLKNLYLLLLFWPLVSVETDCDIQTGDKLKNLIWWLCYAVRGIGLSCFESTCPLGETNHCKSILRRSELSPLAYDETFLMGVVSSRKNNATIHRAQVVIDVFDVCENNVSHKLWPLQSPDYNPIWHLWETLDQHIESTLHHHHTNAKSGNNGFTDVEICRLSFIMFRVFWVVVYFIFLHFPLVFTLCLVFLPATWCWAGAVGWWILAKTAL